MGGQTTYNLTGTPGQPGRPLDNIGPDDIVQAVAGAVIPVGVFCELVLVSGNYLAFPLKDSTTGGSFSPQLIGVSLMRELQAEQTYQTYQVPASSTGSSFAGYPAGFPVAFMRRGRIWTTWDGNTGVALPLAIGAMNVWHSSDGTHSQGVVTTKAVQTTVGQEIDVLPNAVLYDPRQYSGTYTDAFGNSLSMVVMEVGLTGAK